MTCGALPTDPRPGHTLTCCACCVLPPSPCPSRPLLSLPSLPISIRFALLLPKAPAYPACPVGGDSFPGLFPAAHSLFCAADPSNPDASGPRPARCPHAPSRYLWKRAGTGFWGPKQRQAKNHRDPKGPGPQGSGLRVIGNCDRGTGRARFSRSSGCRATVRGSWPSLDAHPPPAPTPGGTTPVPPSMQQER